MTKIVRWLGAACAAAFLSVAALREETPAHLLARICWVGNDGIVANPCAEIVGELAALIAECAAPGGTVDCDCAQSIYAAFGAVFEDWLESQPLDAIPPGVAPIAYRLENDPFRTPFPAQWVIGRNLQFDVSGLSMDVYTPWGSGSLQCALLGRFNASNLLAALASLCVAGLPFEEAVRRLAMTCTVPGRMERFDMGAGRPLAGPVPLPLRACSCRHAPVWRLGLEPLLQGLRRQDFR